MRTSSAIVCLIAAGLIGGAFAPGSAVSADKKPAAVQSAAATTEAVEKGLQLFRKGDFAAAIKVLERPAAERVFMAQYTLAQIYADNSGNETDHAKAYMLFQGIADEYSDVDPDDERRAPYVAKALTALAGYLRVGLPQIGVEPDVDRAADYLHHAALFFGHEDAQFELVKLKLKGEGLPADIASAKHWLAVLTRRGHAGAQAFLADLYARGKIMEKDPVRALALITVAVENAPLRERIWIEDVYQNIYCGSGEGVRKQATGIVAEWRTRYGRKPEAPMKSTYASLEGHATRTCQNGERVDPLRAAAPEPPTSASISPSSTAIDTFQSPHSSPLPAPLPAQAAASATKPDGVREVGVTAR